MITDLALRASKLLMSASNHSIAAATAKGDCVEHLLPPWDSRLNPRGADHSRAWNYSLGSQF